MLSNRPCVWDIRQPRHARLPLHAASRIPQSSQRPNVPAPNPQPSASPDVLNIHGEQPREDPFRWLQAGHRHPQVLRYLQQEHEYSKLQLRHLLPLRKDVEQEIAEQVWRQALMMAAQQPYEEPGRHASPQFGPWEYRREPASGGAARFRHLRMHLDRSASAAELPQQQQDRQHQLQQQQTSAGASPTSREPGAGAPVGASAGPTVSCKGAPRGAQCVLDELHRASSCGSPASAYALHSFAPSPSFDVAAFSETTTAVPPGQRAPDRFQLHVIDAATGEPLLEPLSNVSGDVGWVSLPQGCDGGRGDGAVGPPDDGVDRPGGGGRLYFTRAAQRELWCMDVPPPSAMAAGGGSAAAAGAPVRVFRDPDGQPVHLVQYGRCLYGETLGNTGVPLEIRLLGVCCADGPTGLSQLGLPHGRQSLGSAAAVAVAAAAEAGQLTPAPTAGVPLLPRRPGRQYSALHLDLAAGLDPSGAAAGAASSCASDGPPVAGSSPPDSGEAVESLLLLWLSDLDHPNGCLLLGPMAPGGCVSAGDPMGQPLLLELLPHDPALRIVHVDARSGGGGGGDGGGSVLCVRVAVDARGDPTGRYELDELRIDAVAARRAAVSIAPAAGRDGARLSAPTGGGTAPQAPTSKPWAPSAAPAVDGGDCDGADSGRERMAERPCARTGSSLWALRQRRTVTVRGQRVLRVVDWGEDGRVTLTCSGMASAPSVSTVDLLPYSSISSNGVAAVAEAADAAVAAVAAVAAGPAVELWCEEAADPRVVTERLWARSHDGAQVPITLCRPMGPAKMCGGAQGSVRAAAGGDAGTGGQPRAPQPLLLRVYGAYGRDPPLDFQPALLPLLRRGVAVAVAHVRGGGQLGPGWYEGGRGARKANSHLDLTAAARHLVDVGVTAPGLMCLEAESAGGWAAGPALNEAGASLFRAAVLTVPTLDVLTSLFEDPSYGPYELGDPRADATLYREVRRWSPYDGLWEGLLYPARLLLRVGLYDTNVPYWDPAKYMARLRSRTAGAGAGDALHVMQVKSSGHEAYTNVADDATFCAFVLWALGVWPGV